MEHPSTLTRLATRLRRVRFVAIVALGAAYVLLPTSVGAPWLHPGLLVAAVVVFLWLPTMEAISRHFREGFRDRSEAGHLSQD